jgi:dihydroflavonol-4-reductase
MTAPILVTGGAGFIGSHLVGRLIERGERVRVLELPKANVAHLPAGQVEMMRGDIRDWRFVQTAVRGCRAVFHLAAHPQLWARRRGWFDDVNFRGAVHVLDMALLEGAERIVHVSSESILARAPRTRAGPEEQAIAIDDVAGPYCRAKFRAERHAFQLAWRGGPVVVVSPTLPIGPGDLRQSPPTQMLLDFCRGGRRHYLNAQLNLIDARDVADGLILAMARGVPGRRYILGGESLSLKGLFTQLAAMLRLPAPTRRVPYGIALAAAYVSEWWADVVTQRAPIATVTGVKLTRRRQTCDPNPSLAALGLRPRSVVESLADTIAWFGEMGWIGSSEIPQSTRHRQLSQVPARTAA